MSKIKRMHPADVVDYPKFLGGSNSGTTALHVRQRKAKPELAWTKQLMEGHADWYEVIGIAPIERFEVEYPIRPVVAPNVKLSIGTSSHLGLPRIDAVAYHADGTMSLIEAKLESSPVEMLRGVAQLLYYKMLVLSLEERQVADLILASPSWPAYLIDMIDEYKLPIRLLKVTEDQAIGAIPTHLQCEQVQR